MTWRREGSGYVDALSFISEKRDVSLAVCGCDFGDRVTDLLYLAVWWRRRELDQRQGEEDTNVWQLYYTAEGHAYYQ